MEKDFLDVAGNYNMELYVKITYFKHIFLFLKLHSYQNEKFAIFSFA